MATFYVWQFYLHQIYNISVVKILSCKLSGYDTYFISSAIHLNVTPSRSNTYCLLEIEIKIFKLTVALERSFNRQLNKGN